MMSSSASLFFLGRRTEAELWWTGLASVAAEGLMDEELVARFCTRVTGTKG